MTYENLEHAHDTNKKLYAADPNNKDEMIPTEKVNLGDIINSASSFFHYKGSDTSPPCTQGYDGNGMDWFIQKDIVHMTQEQWQAIYDFFGYPGNARPTQDVDLNPQRVVTYYGHENSL